MTKGYIRYDGLGFYSNKDKKTRGYSTSRARTYDFKEINKYARDLRENYWQETKFILDVI